MKKHILKKTIIVSLAAVIAIGMCACGKTGNADEAQVDDTVSASIDSVDENIEDVINNGQDVKYKITDENISDDDITNMYATLMQRAGEKNADAVVILNKSKEGKSFSIIIPGATEADYESVVDGFALEKVN